MVPESRQSRFPSPPGSLQALPQLHDQCSRSLGSVKSLKL